MRKKIVFLLAFLWHAFTRGCSNGKETSKYNIEYLNKDKTGIAEMPYDASATTTDALIEEFFAALSSDPDNVEYRKPIPNDVEITKYSLDGALLTIYFDVDLSEYERSGRGFVQGGSGTHDDTDFRDRLCVLLCG